MGKTIRASVVVFLLACSVYAGDMQNDVKQPTPPTNATQQAAENGYMPNGEPNGFTETVLSLLESVLTLF